MSIYHVESQFVQAREEKFSVKFQNLNNPSYMHINAYAIMHIHIYAYKCSNICIYMHINAQTKMFLYIYVCDMSVCVCVNKFPII